MHLCVKFGFYWLTCKGPQNIQPMKKIILLYLTTAFILISTTAFSQNKDSKKDDKDTTALLGLPGDNLDLYAVLTLFQKSKTIEAFEKSLNDEKTGINNLDLNLDKKVDFIKVVTKKDRAVTLIHLYSRLMSPKLKHRMLRLFY